MWTNYEKICLNLKGNNDEDKKAKRYKQVKIKLVK